MIFFISNLSISFFIFLFCLYLFSRDDFILLRKNVSLEQIFNYAFISAGIGIISGRIFHVFFHPSLQYLNPLVFLIFIYFPGISVIGSVIGVLIFLFFISRKKKIPRGKIYDIFALSFLPAFASNILIMQLFELFFVKKISVLALCLSLFLFMFSLILAIIFQKGRTKDGIIGTITFICFSFVLFFEDIFMIKNKRNIFFDKEIIVLFILLLVGIFLFIQQKIGRRKR